MTASMRSASTVRGIGPHTAIFPLEHLSARTAPSSTEKYTACMSATSSRFSQKAGIRSSCDPSKLEATSACSTFYKSTREKEISYLLNTPQLLPTIIEGCLVPGLEAYVLKKSARQKIGPSSSQRRTSSIRLLIKPHLRMTLPEQGY